MARLAYRLAGVLVLTCLAACSAATETTDAPDGVVSQAFVGGEFQLQVHRVMDGCLDGSLAVTFMPSGTDSPYPLANTTWIPGVNDVPTTYVMKLNAPFQDMSMTMQLGDNGGLVVHDAPQPAVPLNLSRAGDCLVDMTFDATVDIEHSDSISMVVDVTMSDFRSESQACPTTTAPTCVVQLELTGTRL